MKHGKTERETLDLNGWTIGDILEGDEGYGPHLIKITAVGEERFLCRWNYQKGNGWERESGQTTLSCRKWRKISSVNVEHMHHWKRVGKMLSELMFKLG